MYKLCVCFLFNSAVKFSIIYRAFCVWLRPVVVFLARCMSVAVSLLVTIKIKNTAALLCCMPPFVGYMSALCSLFPLSRVASCWLFVGCSPISPVNEEALALIASWNVPASSCFEWFPHAFPPVSGACVVISVLRSILGDFTGFFDFLVQLIHL